MKAILKDSKGWTKTMTISYPMREIRIPLYRKHRAYHDTNEATYMANDRHKEMVVFELTQRGLNDNTFYYTEVDYGGTSSQASSPYDESNGGANPSTAPTPHKTKRED